MMGPVGILPLQHTMPSAAPRVKKMQCSGINKAFQRHPEKVADKFVGHVHEAFEK
jgi:hypothetical protein